MKRETKRKQKCVVVYSMEKFKRWRKKKLHTDRDNFGHDVFYVHCTSSYRHRENCVFFSRFIVACCCWKSVCVFFSFGSVNAISIAFYKRTKHAHSTSKSTVFIDLMHSIEFHLKFIFPSVVIYFSVENATQ